MWSVNNLPGALQTIGDLLWLYDHFKLKHTCTESTLCARKHTQILWQRMQILHSPVQRATVLLLKPETFDSLAVLTLIRLLMFISVMYLWLCEMTSMTLLRLFCCQELFYEDRHYHEHCFRCFRCDRSLADEPFTSQDDALLCNDCYCNEFSSKCVACDKIVMPGRWKKKMKTRVLRGFWLKDFV